MASQKKSKTSNTAISDATPTPTNIIWWRILITVFVLIIYGNTTSYQYTLDDDIFYQKHASVQKGFDGVSELFTKGSMEQFDGSKGVQPYRPVTLLSFAAEKHFFDNDPAKSHLMNVLLYLIIVHLLFYLLSKLLPQMHPFLIAMMVLLFALHPIHTEVVASVKSRDELLALFFGLTSWVFFIRITQSEKKPYVFIFLSTFFLFTALLSKESAIAFVVLIPLSVLMLSNLEWKKVFISTAPLGLVTLLFLFIRYKVLGTQIFVKGVPVLDNVLHAAKGFSQITATKMEILLYNIKLICWPWPLSWDYSFNQIPVIDWNSLLPWVSLLIHAGLLIVAIIYIRKKPILSFGVFFYLIASSPTNNLFFMNGATIAERFLFTPSLGFVIVLVYLLGVVFEIDLLQFSGKQKNVFVSVLIIVSVAFFLCSFKRVPDWENNFTLFESGVKASPNSSRANQALGTEYENKAKDESDPAEHKRLNDLAIFYLNKSVSILPTNSDATFKLAQVYEMNGDQLHAVEFYKKAIQATPTSFVALNNLGVIYAGQKNFDAALEVFLQAYQLDSTIELTLANLMVVYANKGQFDKVIEYGDRAKSLGIENKKINDLYVQVKMRLDQH